VGKVVAGRGRRAPEAGERPGLQAPGSTNIVEADAVGERRANQRHHTTPRTEGAGAFSHFGFPGERGHQKLGKEVANLPQKIQFRGRWDSWFFIQPCQVAGRNKLFQHFFQTPVGCVWFARIRVKTEFARRIAGHEFQLDFESIANRPKFQKINELALLFAFAHTVTTLVFDDEHTKAVYKLGNGKNGICKSLIIRPTWRNWQTR